MKCCLLIPNYNHGSTINELLKQLATYELPCILIDDGSNEETKQKLEEAKHTFPWVTLITLPENQGKGAAMVIGFNYAIEHGFTHAIQIDADAQHDPNDIPKFLAAIAAHPDALVAGEPIYDETIPKGRLYGRIVANVWVCIETLTCHYRDAMCGYRVYPLEYIAKILKKGGFAKGMGVDIDLWVRLSWRGGEIVSIPTAVVYPDNGMSNFRIVRDNVRISWLHTKLFFGMLLQMPRLLWNKFTKSHPSEDSTHWSEMKEKGCYLGLKITLWTYRFLGRTLTEGLLYFIVGYFYVTHPKTRNASKRYLSKLKHFAQDQKKTILNVPLSAFKHFISFGKTALDKLSVWTNAITIEQIDFPNKSLFMDQINKKKGGVILTAHLGNIEIARALSRFEPDLKINAIVFNEHAKKFNSILDRINPEFNLNMISVKNFDIALAMSLKEKVEAGEFVVIVGDRTSTTNPKRCIQTEFLGELAYLPQGPFILAGLLDCPVYFMLCLKHHDKRFKIIFDQFADSIQIQKKKREQALAYYGKEYARLLEEYFLQYPLQWFNFFDFWKIERS